jgi:hypothetical protein
MSFFPGVYIFSRQFEIDYHVMALVTLGLCFWVYGEHFKRLSYALLFGVCAGCVTLIKFQGLFFLVVPIAYSFTHILRAYKTSQAQQRNMLLSLLVTADIGAMWWGDKLAGVVHSAFAYSCYPCTMATSLEAPILSSASILFYPLYLMHYISVPLWGLFVVAFVSFACAKGNLERKWLVIVSVCVPYIIFTCVAIKMGRYLFPLLPFVAMISAWYIDRIPPSYGKKIFLGGLFAYCVCTFVMTSIPFSNVTLEEAKKKALVLTFAYNFQRDRMIFQDVFKYKLHFDIQPAVITPAKTIVESLAHEPLFTQVARLLAQGKKIHISVLEHNQARAVYTGDRYLRYQWAWLYLHYMFQEYVRTGQLYIVIVDKEIYRNLTGGYAAEFGYYEII